MIILRNEAGETLDYDKCAIKGINIMIPTPSYETEYTSVQGGYGFIPLERTLQPRMITVRFILRAEDFDDSYLLRDELYRLIGREGYLYLSEKRQPYKRWLVYLADGGADTERHGLRTLSTTVNFIAPLGLAESVGTTLSPLRYDADAWQYGQGLTYDDKKYVHDTRKFNIYNAGDVKVDPRKLPLVIKLRGASHNLSLSNKTTGDTWSYDGSTKTNETITLDGVHAYKNNVSIFSQTNKKLLTLAPGNNEIEIVGASGGMLVTFDFRYYYL